MGRQLGLAQMSLMVVYYPTPEYKILAPTTWNMERVDTLHVKRPPIYPEVHLRISRKSRARPGCWSGPLATRPSVYNAKSEYIDID